jgi:hypothetical protein
LESDIQLLELAPGIKDALISSGFLTVKSILNSTTADIASKVGVDLYVAQIIFQEAKRIETEMAIRIKIPLLLNKLKFTKLELLVIGYVLVMSVLVFLFR